MLKGRTKIELTDVKTGEKTTVEKENMVTNTTSKIFNGINSHLYHTIPSTARLYNIVNDHMPIYDKVFGGILLFDDELPESADLVYPPASAHIVGTAGSAYSGTSTWRGTLNTNESGFIYDGTTVNGYRFVWDFGTDKANGTINAVALTSREAGNGACMGISESKESESSGTSSTVPKLFKNSYSFFGNVFYKVYNEGIYNKVIRIDGNDIYYTISDNKTLKKKTVFTPDGISLTQQYPARGYSSDDADEIVATFGYSLSNFTVMPDSNISVTIKGTNELVTHVISVTTWEETETVHTPYTDSSMSNTTYYYYDGTNIYMLNSAGIKVIDSATGSVLESHPEAYMSSPSRYIYSVGDYVIFTNGLSSESEEAAAAFAVNTTDYSVTYCNLPTYTRPNTHTYSYYRQISCEDIAEPYIAVEYKEDSTSGGNDRINILATLLTSYLLTVQNLLSPVTKTNAQTMKVTYEITEDSEPENI